MSDTSYIPVLPDNLRADLLARQPVLREALEEDAAGGAQLLQDYREEREHQLLGRAMQPHPRIAQVDAILADQTATFTLATGMLLYGLRTQLNTNAREQAALGSMPESATQDRRRILQQHRQGLENRMQQLKQIVVSLMQTQAYVSELVGAEIKTVEDAHRAGEHAQAQGVLQSHHLMLCGYGPKLLEQLNQLRDFVRHERSIRYLSGQLDSHIIDLVQDQLLPRAQLLTDFLCRDSGAMVDYLPGPDMDVWPKLGSPAYSRRKGFRLTEGEMQSALREHEGDSKVVALFGGWKSQEAVDPASPQR